MKKFLAWLNRELYSTKFKAMMLSDLAALTAWLSGEIDPEKALYIILAGAIAYIAGVAVEDGAAKLGGK